MWKTWYAIPTSIVGCVLYTATVTTTLTCATATAAATPDATAGTPDATAATTAATAATDPQKVRSAAGQKRLFWLDSFVRTVMATFGGGIIMPLLLGMRPFIFANDCAVPCAAFSWWCVNYFPGDFVYSIMKDKGPARVVCAFFFEVVRGNVILGWHNAAFNVIGQGPQWKPDYYPVPVVGPIAIGTIAGSMGA